MKDNNQVLRIYNVSHPMMMTESFSLLGDKYREALPFAIHYETSIETADVIVWDGLITPKNHELIEVILEEMKKTKVLLLLSESKTLWQDHPIIKKFDPLNLNFVELNGLSILPEEILSSLELCHQKLHNV